MLAESFITFELVPVGLPQMDPSLAQLTQTDIAPSFTAPVPLRLLILGDTLHYDGMKSFFVDYIKAFTRLGMTVTYLDVMCRESSGEWYGPNATDHTAVGAAVLAAGARLIRHCVECPPALCAGDADVFNRASSYEGIMYTSHSWSELPSVWASLLEPLRAVFVQHDVMMVRVCFR